MRHGRYWLTLPLVAPALTGWSMWTLAQAPTPRPTPPPVAEEPADEPSAEDAKEAAVAERFRKVLETNPRRGTALDRLYGYHVERGTIDKLIAGYADRTKKDPKDGVAWTIVGLVESQRGRDAAAVAAFREAETALPDNAIPGYYLGQSLVLVGQPEAAAEAFERAITRKPNRNDLLDIFQALGRVYQRAQRTDKALAVWDRLEKLYPDDARVQEQIATTLVEEGQFTEALPRLEKLAKQTDDKYRQAALKMDVADLKVRLKKTPDALADFEKLLSELNPDSWLHRDVRRRIEDVFLRNDDQAGLAKYYEKWLEKNPADVDAIARLAKTLSGQGLVPDARKWLEKGAAAAPSNRALRQSLIDLAVFSQDYPAAIQQYEAMDKADPNNPDTLREWGKLILRDPAKPEADRKTAAAAVWKRMLAKKPNDPVTASQVADLMRTAGIADDAIALYRKAIELAPNAAQYREYLGEFLHSQGKSADALATWRPIAEGPNRTAKNLVRLAEVFSGFGYKKEAVAAMADAVSLEGDDFGTRMTYADLLHQDGRHADSLQQLDAAARLASNPEENEQVLNGQIKVYQETEKLAERIDELQKELDAGTNTTADRWLRLAKFYEANRQADKATVAVIKAGEKDPKSIPVLVTAARVYEAAGNVLAAAEANRKLAVLDRRFRTEYLQAVAKLEQRLGRKDLALQAGRDLLAASPGNPEVYKFYADLCFQLGDADEGLEALRRSVRANPSDPQGLITLANTLADRARQGEAIELLWRAFDKTNELEGKLGVIDRIAQLYLENNQFDRLMERLERERREAEKTREITLCIAQAYATAGDLGTARQQLERLLTENVRDTHLLGQLTTLCEQEGDLAGAVKYQRQLSGVAPNSYDHQLKLAQLLSKSGESEEAAEIWVKLVSGETEPHRNLAAIDQILTATKYDAALAIITRMLSRKPGDWELVYREGAALAAKGKKDEAAARFRAILVLKLPDDELGEIIKHRIAETRKKAAAAKADPTKVTGPSPSTTATTGTAATSTAASTAAMSRFGTPLLSLEEANSPPLTRRTGNVYRIRQAVGAENDYYSGQQGFYSPSDYGEARMACLGWLNEFARAKDAGDAFVKELRQTKDKPGADPRALWDWYYFQTLRSDSKDLAATGLALSRGDDPSGLLAFLGTLGEGRATQTNQVRRAGSANKDTTPPLPADQLAHALECYRKLKAVKPGWVTVATTRSIMAELKRAKRDDEEKALYDALVKDTDTVPKTRSALGMATDRNDFDASLALFAKLEKLQPAAKKASALGQLPTRQSWRNLLTLMGKRADDKNFADVRKVLDVYLANHRRENQSAPPSASASRRTSSGGISVMLYSKSGSSGRGQATVTYPTANDYYDTAAISLLYNAFDLHKKADVLSDLFAHVRKQVEAATGPERLYQHLALGYLHWWAGEKDEALAQLTKAIETAPGDYNLLMEVADLREQNGEPDMALALLDSITPLDTQVMQRREEAAFRVAERTGNLDRARAAAERLFGLRLDSNKQLDLAAKMHRLGLHEMAETVLGRAQRQAGNKTATLVRLMTQYQTQGQADLAVQIARQIMRKGASVPSPSGGGSETDSARQQAVGVLARSGQIKEMIERAEAQLKASPKSVQIHQTLVGYYQAAGDKEKLKATLLKMADLKPDDGKYRYSVAQQLQQVGEQGAAIAQYKAAIKLDPSVYGNNYYQVQNLFAQANKLEELAELFDTIDLRKIGRYYTVSQLVSNLFENEKTKELALKLFKKGWEAFPEYRPYFLSNLYDESVWRMPEIYDYAKQGVIPREDSMADPWQSVSNIMSYGQEGRCETVVTRMMTIARRQHRLPELRAEVAAALAKKPDWIGGKALLAVIDVQTGRKDESRKLWSEVFDAPNTDIPPIARFILCQELEFYSGVEDMAVKTLEAGADDMMRDGNYDFSYNPARRLMWWYEQAGRKDDARNLLRRFAKVERTDPGYSGGYWQYQLVRNSVSVAQEFQKVGDPVEAVRIFQNLLADRETLDLASQYGGEHYVQQVEQGLRTALKAIKPNVLPSAVGALLTPRTVTPANPAILDLVLVVEPRDLGKASLTGMFAAAIKATDKAPDIRRSAADKLAELAKKHPTDVSVRTAAALVAFADGGNPDSARDAVDQLVKLIDATPLDPLPDGKANARQRAEALQQVLVWLVARECFGPGREKFRETGEKLAERALAGAKRQVDKLQAIAILREWGQFDLDHGDKAKAEARWAEMAELVLPKVAPAKKAEAPTPAPNPAMGPQTVFVRTQIALPAVGMAVGPGGPAASPAPARRSGNVPVLTTDQFQRAYELSKMAAEKGLPALSLRVIREAVRGGPPVADKPNNNRGGGSYRQITVNGVQYLISQDSNSRQVTPDMALVNLVPKWRAAGVTPVEIYEVLAAAVLPDARPAEVFAFGETRLQGQGEVYKMVGGSWTLTTDLIEETGADRGLAGMLCDIAVEAGKTDALRARLESRVNQPLGEMPARVLLVALAKSAKDDARMTETYKALGERLKKDTQQTTNDRVSTILEPALTDPKFAQLVAPFVEKAAENYAAANNTSRAADLHLKLAKWHLSRKDEAAARGQFKMVEEFGKKIGQGEYDPRLPLAQEYLKLGWSADALLQLGLTFDTITAASASADPAVIERRTDPTLNEFSRLVQVLYDMPAAARYEALRGWTLPDEKRKWVRYYVGVTPRVVPPPQFGKPPAFPTDQPTSTILLLAEAAKECGKADELVAAIDKLAADKIENAELLRVLAYLGVGRGKQIEPVVKAFAEATLKRLTQKQEEPVYSRYGGGYRGPLPYRPSEFLFASLCLKDPAFAEHGSSLLKPLLQRVNETGTQQVGVAHIQAVQNRLEATRAGAPDALVDAAPLGWSPSNRKGQWFTHGGYLSHAGEMGSHLMFDTPLVGAFEFSFEVVGYTYGGPIGYGGVVFGPGAGSVWAIGGNDQIQRPAVKTQGESVNRITIQASPDKVRCLMNGQLFYEDTDMPPTSPWLMLAADHGSTAFRNPVLTGTPEVPAEVKLTAGDFLGGWMAQPYPGTLPARMAAKEPKPEPDPNNGFIQEEASPDLAEKLYTWQAKDGEVLGRKTDRPGELAVPSNLRYIRPLRAGDRVRYEFFHDPGKVHVSPSLGRLAFLLEPGGVKLHWMADAAEEWTGLSADNAADDPAGKRTDKLPLKAGDWNAVVLTTTPDGVKIELNGMVVYEAAVPADLERQFGLFHYRDKTVARVRNVVLTGGWKPLASVVDVAFVTNPTTPAVVNARRRLLGEKYELIESGEVVERVGKLSPTERFKTLADWVLPSEGRPLFRLAGAVKPGNESADTKLGEKWALPAARFAAPCLELIAAAMEAGTLGELAERIASADSPEADDVFRRSKTALLVATRAAQGKDDEAAKGLTELLKAVGSMRLDAPAADRWPDLIAVVGSLGRPGLLKPAGDLAAAMAANLERATEEKKSFDQQHWWQSAVPHVRAWVAVAAQPDGVRRAFGTDPGFAHWAASSGQDLHGSGAGWGPTHWSRQGDTITHFPGQSDDCLILRTPLVGNFEVACELRSKVGRQASIRYAGITFELLPDRKKYRLSTTVREGAARETTIKPPLPESQAEFYAFRLSVKDGWLKFFVDDREVAAERIGPNPDPWLMLCAGSLNMADVRNLRLTGTPAAPERIDLLASDEIPLWRPRNGQVAQDAIGNNRVYRGSEDTSWQKRGEELFAFGKTPEPPENGKPVPPRHQPESAIFYERSLLEDGVVEYEFFHDPGVSHADPALGRLVFLLEPDGVKLHRLTDGLGGKDKLAVDNAADEPENRKGPTKLPLKTKAWNRVRLAVAGDRIKVSLNGEEVYDRSIEPTNSRRFGVFHYTDRTQARVRSMTMTGDWPKQLPAAEKLFDVK